MQELAQPREALYTIMEAGLFGFRLDPARRTFTLVTEYPFKSPGSVREFVAFVFSDVDFHRELGDQPDTQAIVDDFQAVGPGAYVVQNVKQGNAIDGRSAVEVWFGPNLGGIRVTYGDVKAFTRGSVAEQVGSEWKYRDSRTNRPFDFYRPFPELLPA